MISASFTSFGDDLTAALEVRAWEGIQRATVYLHQQVLQTLNVPNSGERVASRTRKTKSGRPARTTVYRSPSKPGEAPRKRTGWLQRNVQYALERRTLTSRVGIGAGAKYGMWLELGTRRMRPRPWLWATAQRHLARLKALAGRA